MSSQELKNSDSSSTVSSDDEDETIVDISSNGYESLENNHLSDVLSQIQDDGPAYDESMKQAEQSEPAGNADVKQSSPEKQQESVSKNNVPPAQEKKVHAKVKKILVHINSYADLIQLVLIIFIAAASGFMFFNLDSRANELEVAMQGYEIELQDNTMMPGDDTQTKVEELNKTITLVQEDLALVTAKHTDLDKKYEMVIKTATETKESDLIIVKGNVNALESDVLTLKEEVNAMKKAFEVSSTNKASSKKITGTKAVSKPVSNGLIVNLASLTNIDKVDELVNKIYKTGLSPAVEKATVNGKRVYRISVSGFADVKAANVFINKAAKQYGTTGARIRKS